MRTFNEWGFPQNLFGVFRIYFHLELHLPLRSFRGKTSSLITFKSKKFDLRPWTFRNISIRTTGDVSAIFNSKQTLSPNLLRFDNTLLARPYAIDIYERRAIPKVFSALCNSTPLAPREIWRSEVSVSSVKNPRRDFASSSSKKSFITRI